MGPSNNGMKLTGSAMRKLPRPLQLIPVFCGRGRLELEHAEARGSLWQAPAPRRDGRLPGHGVREAASRRHAHGWGRFTAHPRAGLTRRPAASGGSLASAARMTIDSAQEARRGEHVGH